MNKSTTVNALGLHRLRSRMVCTCPRCRSRLAEVARRDGMSVDHLVEVLARGLAGGPRPAAPTTEGARPARVVEPARPRQQLTAPVAERMTVAGQDGPKQGPAAILAVVQAVRE